MKLIAKVRVSFNTPLARQMGESFTTECAAAFGDRVQELARHNVAPGVGPGPHPHPERDTGNLMESITAGISKSGAAVTASVYTPVVYGLYLEAGWHARSGRFYRYPWLQPAIDVARKEFMDLVRAKAAVAFTGGAHGGLITVKKGSNPWEAPGWRKGA